VKKEVHMSLEFWVQSRFVNVNVVKCKVISTWSFTLSLSMSMSLVPLASIVSA